MPKHDTTPITATATKPKAVDDRYLSLTQLVRYSGLSDKTLRRAMSDPDHPLPSYRVGGRVLVRRSEFDQWVETQQPPGARRADTDLAERARAAARAIRGDDDDQ